MIRYLTVGASTIVWFICFLAAKFLLPAIFPPYRKWDDQKKYQACGLIPSSAFVLSAVPLSIWILNNDDRIVDVRINGQTEWSMFLVSMATGYFVYDTLIIFIHLKYEGVSMLVHGILCLVTYGIAVVFDVYNGYGPVFLMFLVELGYKTSTAYDVNGIILTIVFGVVRLGYGLYMSYLFWIGTINGASDGSLPLLIALWYGTSNLCLNGLNIFWYYKILIGAVKAYFRRMNASADPKDR